MAQLPDPTIDLDWSGYAGSIQWHFGEVARQHPDRTCVMETKSSEGPERRFTYKQIYEASNALAHYLRDAGVANGDVVMIWAHRSVDLVISIMGTLVCFLFAEVWAQSNANAGSSVTRVSLSLGRYTLGSRCCFQVTPSQVSFVF